MTCKYCGAPRDHSGEQCLFCGNFYSEPTVDKLQRQPTVSSDVQRPTIEQVRELLQEIASVFRMPKWY